MKKINIVKNNREFNDIIKTGRYAKSKSLVIYYKENNLNIYRFGISVGTKIGNAVIRNRIKRQMRNIVDIYKKNYQIGRDYIIIVRNSYLDLNSEDAKNNFIELISKIK